MPVWFLKYLFIRQKFDIITIIYYFCVVINIFRFNKREEHKEYFFSFEPFDSGKHFVDKKNNIDNEQIKPTTVFEQVLARQKKQENNGLKKIIIAITMFVVLIALSVFGHYLTVYQKNTPIALCDKIADAFKENNADVLVDTCTNLPEILKEKNNLKEYFDTYLKSRDISYYAVAPDYKSEKKYIFKSGSTKIGEIVFREKDEKAAYGVKSYFIRKFDIIPLTGYKIYTSSFFDVKVNGEKIPDKYLFSKTEIASPIKNFTGNKVTKNLYVIDDFFYVDEITANDYDGKKCEIKYDSAISQYEITKGLSDEINPISDFTASFVLDYLTYTLVNEGEADKALQYIHPNSVLYKNTEKYEIIEEDEYIEESIENFAIKNIECYGGGFYSCDMTVDYVTVTEEDTITFKWNKKLFILKEKDKYYIIDIL